MKPDYTKLEHALAEGNREEARAIIDAILAEDLTEEQEGAALLSIAAIYMDTMNSIKSEYRDSLKKAIAELETLNKEEQQEGDTEKLSDVRKNLGID